MISRKTIKCRDKRGFAYILALILLGVFVTLSVVMATTTNMSLRKSDNNQQSNAALVEAENGLQFMLQTLKATRLPGSTTEATFTENLAEALGEQLDGSANLGGQAVAISGAATLVPTIATPLGQFDSSMALLNPTRLRLEVTGSQEDVSRKLSIDCDMVPRRPAVFDYGLASKGQVFVHGSANIVGVNFPTEASVLSATQSVLDAIVVDGMVTISGDLYAAGEDAGVAISGSPSIAGSRNPLVYGPHIHAGVDVPDFPTVNTAPLRPLATSVITASTPIPNGATFNNVRIAAGTNPVFSNDVTLNGIIYVESPNIVKFQARTVIRGMVVTEPSATQTLANCQILFGGRVEAYGVETLPNTAQFEAVKQNTGSFVVAPGFGVTFAGTFSAINGCIAADQLTFTGTAEGTVRGSVIGLTDVLTDVGGNVDIYVDRKDADQNPTGFVNSIGFVPDPASYAEHMGG